MPLSIWKGAEQCSWTIFHYILSLTGEFPLAAAGALVEGLVTEREFLGQRVFLVSAGSGRKKARPQPTESAKRYAAWEADLSWAHGPSIRNADSKDLGIDDIPEIQGSDRAIRPPRVA